METFPQIYDMSQIEQYSDCWFGELQPMASIADLKTTKSVYQVLIFILASTQWSDLPTVPNSG